MMHLSVTVLLCGVFFIPRLCSLGILTLSMLLAPIQNSCLLRANSWLGQEMPTFNTHIQLSVLKKKLLILVECLHN